MIGRCEPEPGCKPNPAWSWLWQCSTITSWQTCQEMPSPLLLRAITSRKVSRLQSWAKMQPA